MVGAGPAARCEAQTAPSHQDSGGRNRRLARLQDRIEAGTGGRWLYQWLKDNKYNFSGDEATLNHYVQKKWLFTVMKIDTMQMKRNKHGTFDGEVTPTPLPVRTHRR